jgi:hypothetical protein
MMFFLLKEAFFFRVEQDILLQFGLRRVSVWKPSDFRNN